MALHIGAIFFCCFLSLSFALDLSSCGTAKSCIYSTSGCLPTSPSCLVFTYSYDSSQNIFNMELSGGSGDGMQYVGVAFSPTGEMENSDFYYCSGNEFKSGVIVGEVRPTVDSSLPTGVSAENAMTNGGVAECTFVRPASLTKTISSNPTTFDLATTQYHLLLAVGDLSNNQLQYHGPINRFSLGPYNYTVTIPASDEPTPATSSTTTTTTTTNQQAEDDGTGCGTRIGCFRDPNGCLPESNGCKFLSWTYDSSQDTFNFNIVGGSAGQYAAIAFGTQSAMVNADLYYCTENGLVSGAIVTQNSPPTVANSIPSGITNVNNSVSNGVLRCSFTRAASITKALGSSENDFNLGTTSYYLLYAVGTSTNDQLSYHGANRVLSGAPIDFKSFEAAGGGGGSNTRDLIKAHASLMLIAWITCASVGAIIARHFKPLWHGKTLGGVKVWFQLHRTLMVTAVLCTAIAFILIFTAIGTFSGAHAGAHPIIGIVVTALALLNPLMALCRPHPGEPRRYIFNWAHWFVGSSARILGLVAIFLGVDLGQLDLPEWDTWVLVGFVVFHVVTEIALEIVSAMYGHIAGYRKKKKTDDIDLGGDDNPQDDPPPKGSGIKYAILTIYILVNLCFLITFIVYVARN